MDKTSPPISSPILCRRNSISTTEPHKLRLSHRNSSFPSDNLELLSIKPTPYRYSSLKDLLPSATVNSPKASFGDICIRNRLVKQAARAYLQPMSTSTCSSDENIFHRLWRRVAAAVDVLCRNVVRAFDGTFRVVGIRSSGFQRSRMCLV